MIAADNILDIIVLEFPKYKRNITMLYNECSNFIEVCEDYALCLEALKKLEAINNPVNKKEINDLKQAMNELKDELFLRI